MAGLGRSGSALLPLPGTPPRPLNAPGPPSLPPAVVPGSRSVIRARQVIVSGAAPGSGVFVYSSTPRAGDLAASLAGSATTDPFGNPVDAGITSYDNVFGGVTQIVGALIQMFSGINLLQKIAPSGYVIYSPNAAAGNVILSLAPAAFTDAYGNAILAGLTSYTQSGVFIASQVFNGKLQFWTAASQAGPWTANGPSFTDFGSGLLISSGKQGGTTDSQIQMTAGTALNSAPIAMNGVVVLPNMAAPSSALAGNAVMLFANGGHLNTVSTADGNNYDTERLSLLLGAGVTVGTGGRDIFTHHLDLGKYVIEFWAVTSNTIAADFATWGFTFTGTNVAPTLMKFVSMTSGTAVVGYGASATLTTTFSGQNFAGNQDVYMRLTVNVSVAGTLAIHGVTAASTVTVFAGAELRIQPSTAT